MKQDTPTLEKVLEEGKVFKTRYKTKSVSRTYRQGDHYYHVLAFFEGEIKTAGGRLKDKYTITITKHLEDDNSSN